MNTENWIKRIKGDWFSVYFGEKDNRAQRAPAGPPGSSRQVSDENSSLLVANPNLLDLHISHSLGLENGPIIQRSGDSSPLMEDPEQPGTYTTDPELQRIGSYYILESIRGSHIHEVFYRFVGNYILLNHVNVLGTAATFDLVSSHFVELQGFPVSPDFRAGTFANDIFGFIEPLGTFLMNYNSSLAAIFKTSIASANVAEAARSMDKLYEKTFPNYLIDFYRLQNVNSFRNTIKYNALKYLRLLILILKTSSHEERATRLSDGEIVLMQGCGDLTMNEWNVAFITNKSYIGTSDWRLLHPPEEPLNDRSYTCLLKWSCSRSDPDLLQIARDTRVVYPYQIARLKFKAPSLEFGPPNRHVFLNEHPIGHLIEFAVYGQQVCKDGKIVPLQSIIREFADIRHIYKLPNLNRDESYLSETESYGITEYKDKPRNLFNQSTRDDVWLGEAALIQGDRNIKVAGLTQPIQLDLRHLGSPKEWIEIVLTKEENTYYTYTKTDREMISVGEWKWIVEGRRTWLEIYFLHNQYPCTMIGIRAQDEGHDVRQSDRGIVDCEDMFFLAHGHNYTWKGCTIEESAQYLLDIENSWNTLLFDEGNDVFQLIYDPQEGGLVEKVPLKRKELRCVFWGTMKEAN